MTVEYTLKPELRTKLQKPFGTLIRGSFDETMRRMEQLMEKEKPSRIISVGDVVSRNLHEHHIHPQLTIIDNKSLRTQQLSETPKVEKTVHVVNPQGTITREALAAVKEAIERDEHTHIIVNGEEDLLTLAAVLYAPEKAVVVYGQPHKGIVAVWVTSQKKAQVKKLLKAMEPFEKLNRKKTV